MQDHSDTHSLPANERYSTGVARVTLIPYLDSNGAEHIPRVLPHVRRFIEHQTIDHNGSRMECEETQFHCTYPTIAAARKACSPFQKDARIHIEAPFTLHEEEFEALAKYHVLKAAEFELMTTISDSEDSRRRFLHHRARLYDIAGVLGDDAVQRIYDEHNREVSRVPTAGEAARAEVKTRLLGPRPRRHR